MAWMRMMGAHSVAYHEDTVLGRKDDFPGRALAYYASRGETPLVWGGAGAERLGLVDRVTGAQYRAIYGPGGACDPTTGEGLVSTTRPGMELVISARKSVAELGVIGRAEDMHRIMDAERETTLSYLEAVTQARGGRRGRQRTATATSGLVYAYTRHATSPGDPCPHDHVLVANLVEMLDTEGGWKAADTTLWREHLHAATIAGRVAAARTAVELGYAITPDHGPSGRLGHWRIVGIPYEVLEIHSKRAAEISEAVEARGKSSYRARNIAARDTRAVKRHTPVGELMPRWRDELAEVGWTVPELIASVERAGQEAALQPPLSEREITRLMADALSPAGPLSVAKVFTAADVVVAVGPALYGRPVEDLNRVVQRVLTVPDCVPLLGVKGARQRTYATAAALATEAAIAELVARGTGTTRAVTAPSDLVDASVARAEQVLSHPRIGATRGSPRHLRRRATHLPRVGRCRCRKDHGNPMRRRSLHRRWLRSRRHGYLGPGRPHSRPRGRSDPEPDSGFPAVAARPRHPAAHLSARGRPRRGRDDRRPGHAAPPDRLRSGQGEGDPGW